MLRLRYTFAFVISKGFEDCSILNQLLVEYDHDLKITIKTFSSRRIPDAEAISDLAFYNYIEVRKYLFTNFNITHLFAINFKFHDKSQIRLQCKIISSNIKG